MSAPQKSKDKVAIVGGGMAGLSAGFYLSKYANVSIYEASSFLGGLAGVEEISIGKHSFVVEKFYHHFFKKDKHLKNLLQDLGLSSALQFYSVKNKYASDSYSLKSVLLLLSLISIPSYKIFKYKAFRDFYKTTENDYLVKLLKSKFGDSWQDISIAWLWARLHSRFSFKDILIKEKLGVILPSFNIVLQKLEENLNKNNAKIYLNSPVKDLRPLCSKFNHVVLTIPLENAYKLLSKVINKKLEWYPPLYRGAFNALFVLKHDNSTVYWDQETIVQKYKDLKASGKLGRLKIFKDYPFLVRVNQHLLNKSLKYPIVYIGGYVDSNHLIFASKKQNVLKEIQQIFGIKNSNILYSNVFSSKYAQHVPTVEYVRNLPKNYYNVNFNGNQCNVYIKSFGNIFPWDRGVNWAVAPF